MLDAFETAAGFSASELKLMIQMFFAGILTIWVAWVAYRQFFLFAKGVLKPGEWGKNMIFLIMIWTFLMLIIVT
jgi:hypothetical protein